MFGSQQDALQKPVRLPDSYGRKTCLIKFYTSATLRPSLSGVEANYGDRACALRNLGTSVGLDGTYGGCITNLLNNSSSVGQIWTATTTVNQGCDRFHQDFDILQGTNTQQTWRESYMSSARCIHSSVRLIYGALQTGYYEPSGRVYMGSMPASAWQNHNLDSNTGVDLGWWQPQSASGSSAALFTESSCRSEVAMGRAIGPISIHELRERGGLEVDWSPTSPGELTYLPDMLYGNTGGGYSSGIPDMPGLNMVACSIQWAAWFDCNSSLRVNYAQVYEYEPDPVKQAFVEVQSAPYDPTNVVTRIGKAVTEAQFAGSGGGASLRGSLRSAGRSSGLSRLNIADTIETIGSMAGSIRGAIDMGSRIGRSLGGWNSLAASALLEDL